MLKSRRTFLANATGAAIACRLHGAGSVQAAQSGDLRVIPKTGEHIPVIGLGSWITFNVGSDPALLDHCAQVISNFSRDGGGMIDCSPMYGSSQYTIGHGLARLGDVSNIFSAEKIWISSPGDGPGQIEATRRSWGVRGFDLMQIHNLRAWNGHIKTLLEMKADGRLRYIGITTSHGRRHRDLEQIMLDVPIDFVQLTYNALDRQAEARLLPLARERGIAVIVNRPFRQGALIDRFRRTSLPAWAAEIGAASWAQILLKFIISHPAVTVVIPATRQVAHLRENKAAARGPLPDADLRRRMAEDIARI